MQVGINKLLLSYILLAYVNYLEFAADKLNIFLSVDEFILISVVYGCTWLFFFLVSPPAYLFDYSCLIKVALSALSPTRLTKSYVKYLAKLSYMK